ncbi:MAG: type III polyketide synthase, partial [Dehalococcoidia bacterium]
MARILALGTALPPHRLDNAAFRQALSSAFSPYFDDMRPLLRMAERCGVAERYIAEPSAEILRLRSLTESNRRYAELAVELGEAACLRALTAARVSAADVDLIVTASCTGYVLPSLDAQLVARLGLRSNVRRLPITELGCLAGAASLARAAELLKGCAGTVALVVAVELPSLTFQPGDGSMDNLISTLVFGDGAGAAVLHAGSEAGIEIVASRGHIVPGTLDEMGFELRESGFHVVLTKDVPALLDGPFAAEMRALLREHGLRPRDLG